MQQHCWPGLFFLFFRLTHLGRITYVCKITIASKYFQVCIPYQLKVLKVYAIFGMAAMPIPLLFGGCFNYDSLALFKIIIIFLSFVVEVSLLSYMYQKKIVIKNKLSISYRRGKSMHYPESPKVTAYS